MLDTRMTSATLRAINKTRVPNMFRPLKLAVFLGCIAIPAKAHEFWIDPEAFEIEPGGTVVAAIRVGQDYKGSSYSYLPPQFRRFDYALGEEVLAVPGLIGDRPAVTMQAPGEGLLTLIHVTTDYTITWSDFADFEAFVDHKDARWTLDAHKARGLTTENVREVYSRHAKSLIAVGGGEGTDREYGLETEIVALENPYLDDVSDGIDIQVFYQGQPRQNEQVEIYEKAGDETVLVSTVRTDAEGKATIPVRPGFRYMLDSVVLREPSAEMAADKDVVWESLWANLTFEVPGD